MAEIVCTDKKCPRHGGLKTRGAMFEGKVVNAHSKNTAIVEIGYYRPVPKYERLEKKKSKFHVHIPGCMTVKEGSVIKFMECRKLSKTKSFVITD